MAALARASRRTRRVDGRTGMRWKGHGSVTAITVVRHERERRVRRAATGRRPERGRKRFGGAWTNGVIRRATTTTSTTRVKYGGRTRRVGRSAGKEDGRGGCWRGRPRSTGWRCDGGREGPTAFVGEGWTGNGVTVCLAESVNGAFVRSDSTDDESAETTIRPLRARIFKQSWPTVGGRLSRWSVSLRVGRHSRV